MLSPSLAKVNEQRNLQESFDTLDYVWKGYVNAPIDQMNCQSDAFFAVTTAIEGAILVNDPTKGLRKISDQQLINCYPIEEGVDTCENPPSAIELLNWLHDTDYQMAPRW